VLQLGMASSRWQVAGADAGRVVDQREDAVTSKSNRYSGLLGSRIYRSKYQDCQYSEQRGITVRLLTQKEIEEFRFHVDQVMSRQLPKKVPL
jgi:hypothetical protein